MVNDILLVNSENTIFAKYTSHFAIQIFVFLQSIMLIHKWILVYKEKERLQEALDFKNRVFSIIAHDLRSPVASLIQITEFLKEDSIEKDNKEFRKSAHELAKSAGELIDNLLYWGGSQGDQIHYSPDSCDVSGIVSEVFNVFKEMAKQKSITLKYVFKGEKYAFCDRELIMIIIRNLTEYTV